MINSIKLFSFFYIFSTILIHSSAAAKDGDATSLAGIYIKSHPAGADVYLDHIKVGNTSPAFQKMGLIPDQLVTVTLRKQDYNPLTFKVQIQAGLNKFENLTLKPAFGYLTLNGNPSDAEISVDGKVIGRLEKIDRYKLKSGRHRLDAQKEGMEPLVNIVIKIFDDELSQESIELKIKPGAVPPEKIAEKELPGISRKKEIPVPKKKIISNRKTNTGTGKIVEPPKSPKRVSTPPPAEKPVTAVIARAVTDAIRSDVPVKKEAPKKSEQTPEKIPVPSSMKKVASTPPNPDKAGLEKNIIETEVDNRNEVPNESYENGLKKKTPFLAENSTDIPGRNFVIIKLPTDAGSNINIPETINITEGEYVLWKNQDKRFHYIVQKQQFSLYSSYGSEEEGDEEEKEEEDTASTLFNSPKLKNGDSWAFQFQNPGTYDYYCFLHPLEIVGRVVVSDTGTNTSIPHEKLSLNPEKQTLNGHLLDELTVEKIKIAKMVVSATSPIMPISENVKKPGMVNGALVKTAVNTALQGKVQHPEKEKPGIPDNRVVVIALPDNNGSFINKPESLKINSGESVLWKNRDKRFHYIVYKPQFTNFFTSYGRDNEEEEEDEEDTSESLFNSPKLSSGDSWSFQFDDPGSYSYYCFIHPLEIVGQVIVE